MTLICCVPRAIAIFGLLGVYLAAGCAPSARITFPVSPERRDDRGVYFDVDRNGAIDFALLTTESAKLADVLAYDDDEDGNFDRRYRLNDYDDHTVPHLIILIDSIPFETIATYYERGGFRMFPPPVKVIPPFPSMSGVIFSQLLDTPPLPGMINRHYNRSVGAIDNRIMARIGGHVPPWHLRLHERPKYWENGLMFLRPRSWYPAELARVRDAVNESPDRITIAYIASTSGILSQYGVEGMDDILAQLEALCLQLLHERHGAIRISMVSDHGHNLVPATRISLDDTIRESGFRVRKRLVDTKDVVCDIDGLVNYMGLHTKQPAALVSALLTRDEIELAAYYRGDTVVVCDARGSATIEYRDGSFRYHPDTFDVFDYGPLLDEFAANGVTDADGFVSDRTWFDATVDHEWPDAPRRLWDAFHGLAINTPDVMITYRDGVCTGLGFLDAFINMASTHGGLDQQDSAAFALSMTGRLDGPLRTADVMKTIEPDYTPSQRPGND